jgi:hypothetical protein
LNTNTSPPVAATAAVDLGQSSAEDIKKKFTIPEEPFRLAVQDFLNNIACHKLQLSTHPEDLEAFRTAVDLITAKELMNIQGDGFMRIILEDRER